MAQEITVTHSFTVIKGNLKIATQTESFKPTLNGDDYDAGSQIIGFAAHEVLAFKSDLASVGLAKFKNLDSTNYVDIGRDVSGTFYPVWRLLAGESYPIRLSQSALYAKANVAAVKLEFTVLEN